MFTFETITVLVVLAIFVVFAFAANKAEKAIARKVKEQLTLKSTAAAKTASAKGKK